MDLVMCHCNMVAAGQKKKKKGTIDHCCIEILLWVMGSRGVSEIMATT